MKRFLSILILLLFPVLSDAGSFDLPTGTSASDTLKSRLEEIFLNPPVYGNSKGRSEKERRKINSRLEELWDKYWDKYEDAKTLVQQRAALNDIIDFSSKNRLDSSLLEAYKELYDSYVDQNYKWEDSIRNVVAGKIEDYGNNLMTCLFYLHDNFPSALLDKKKYIRTHKEELMKTRTASLYDKFSVGRCLGGLDLPVIPYIQNDYEYLLWYDFFENDRDNRLREYISDMHPQTELYEVAKFLNSDMLESSIDCTSILEKYRGTLLEFYMRSIPFISSRYDRYFLDPSLNLSKLYPDCCTLIEDVETAENKYTAHKDCLRDLRLKLQLEKSKMEAKRASCYIENGKVYVVMLNVDKAVFSISRPAKRNKEPEVIFKKEVRGNKRGVGIKDTVSFDCPSFADGRYELNLDYEGKRLSETSKGYSQKTISAMIVRAPEGYWFLASDYKTGKPLQNYYLTLYQADETILEGAKNSFVTRLCSSEIKADTSGFILLDGEIGERIAEFEKSVESMYNKARGQILALEASYTDENGILRRSQYVGVDRPYGERYVNKPQALVMTDNVIYHPKDSLKFKVVVYEGSQYTSFKTSDSGDTIKVRLLDQEEIVVDSTFLTLNSFGSASAAFLIPEGKKNGRWCLIVGKGQSSYVGGIVVRVDDYALPTYSVELDRCYTMLNVGDTIRVTGRITGYSGHPVTDAKVKMAVELYDPEEGYTVLSERAIHPLEGGRIEEKFVADASGKYFIAILVTDKSGETVGSSTNCYVNTKDVVCSLHLVNNTAGDSYPTLAKILCSDTAIFEVHTWPNVTRWNESWDIPYKFRIWDMEGNVVFSRDNIHEHRLKLDLSAFEDGYYRAEAFYDKPKYYKTDYFLLIRDTLPKGVDAVFIYPDSRVSENDSIRILIGIREEVYLTAAVTAGPAVTDWRFIHFKPNAGNRLQKISFAYKDSYPDAVTASIHYSRNGHLQSWERVFTKSSRTLDMKVQSVEFKDELSPSEEYRFSFKLSSSENAEAVASAYDIAADALLGYDSKWETVSLSVPSARSFVSAYSGAGDLNRGFEDYRTGILRSVQSAVGSAVKYVGGALRSDFKDALFFIPHIVSKDSTISFTFKTSDKLSTYHLNLFAHTRDMHNAFFRRDFTVTLPLKVSISQPRYLYRGDKYDISATVSAKEENAEGAKDGKVVEVYNGQAAIQAYCRDSLLLSYTDNLKLSSGTSSSFNDVVAVGSGVDTIGLKVSYLSDKHSDAVLVKIPVFDNTQKITEAHSAVLLHNSDRTASVAHLKDRFTAMNPDGALEKEETYSDILAGLLDKHSTAKDLDVISVMDAFCFSKMASSDLKGMDLPDTLWNNLLSFRNLDGGFGWFKQMRSSQAITAAVLERFALLRDSGYEIPDLTQTLKYLDSTQFEIEWPWWFGLVNSQYVYVRSLYPEVPFKAGRTASSVNNYGRFRTWIRNYLNPPKDNGKRAVSRKAGKQAGFIDFDKSNVLEKASRTVVLRNLMSSEAGRSLIKSWAGKSYSQKALQNTIDKDVFQITDYAVHHPDGGTYYPNAAMPFKGNIENEAYTHSMISDALSGYAGANNSDLGQTASRIADQVRLWLMLQAQTQDWDKNFYFINAVRSMSMASDSIRKTSVLTLSKTEEMPFSHIKASQNGMTVERVFYRDNEILKPGDTLRRGDRIRAEYRIWNKENRSFVKLTAPREACLMPVNQLSGQSYGLKSLMVNNWFEFAPSLYRNVKKDRTEYFFDVLSEEKTVIKEDFYVVQDGVFSAPVVEIESLYAPAYRANDSFKGSLPVERE